MKEIKLNKYTEKLYIIYDNIKFTGISVINSLNVSLNYELTKQFNKDGFNLENLSMLNELNVDITFYTKDVKNLGNYFKLGKMAEIYFNNTTFSYRGFINNFTVEKFKNDIKKVVVHFVLQPFCCKNSENINISGNGVIANEGHTKLYPKMVITPTSNDFSIAINGIKMEFKASEIKPYNVDLENVEISDMKGNLKNSIFLGGKIPYLDVGVNPIILNNCTAKFIVNWRYVFNDLLTNK